jgi:hypothetical protein
MLERPDRVRIALPAGEVTIAWDARQALMRRLQHVKEGGRIRESFEAGRATPPVRLNQGQCDTLHRVLLDWPNNGMPPDLRELADRLT